MAFKLLNKIPTNIYCGTLRLMQLLLRKIPKFHLISWSGNFVEKDIFHRVLGDSSETPQKLYLTPKFSHQEIRWNLDILRSVCHRVAIRLEIVYHQVNLHTTVHANQRQKLDRMGFVKKLKKYFFFFSVCSSAWLQSEEKQEILRVVTIAIICSTLASLWKFQ